MIVVIDDAAVRLIDPEEFGRFEIVSSIPAEALDAALARSGAGVRADEGHVAVDPEWIRAAARPASDAAAWQEGFAAMVGYARSKGWVTAEGAVLGHLAS